MKSLSFVKLSHLTGPIIGCGAGESGVGVQTVFRSYRTFSAEDYSGFYGRLLTHHISNVATQVSTYLSLIDLPPLVDRNIDSQLHHAHCRCHNRSADRGWCGISESADAVSLSLLCALSEIPQQPRSSLPVGTCFASSPDIGPEVPT